MVGKYAVSFVGKVEDLVKKGWSATKLTGGNVRSVGQLHYQKLRHGVQKDSWIPFHTANKKGLNPIQVKQLAAQEKALKATGKKVAPYAGSAVAGAAVWDIMDDE